VEAAGCLAPGRRAGLASSGLDPVARNNPSRAPTNKIRILVIPIIAGLPFQQETDIDATPGGTYLYKRHPGGQVNSKMGQSEQVFSVQVSHS
jgi:hypothetical protein